MTTFCTWCSANFEEGKAFIQTQGRVEHERCYYQRINENDRSAYVVLPPLVDGRLGVPTPLQAPEACVCFGTRSRQCRAHSD